MRYVLSIYCDVCGKIGQGQLATRGGVVPPGGWGGRRWPSGQMSMVCSKPCATEVEKQQLRKSIIVPKPPVLVARNA